jgi:hypothetical protein
MGKYLQEIEYTCCFLSDLTDLHSISLFTFPLFLSKSAYAALHLFLYFKLLWRHPHLIRGPRIGASAKSGVKGWWRERDSNPRCPFRNIHDFQSCSFNHSDISPKRSLFLRIQLLQCNFNITWSFFSYLSTFFSYLSFARIFCALRFFFTTSNCISKVTKD